MIKTGLIAVLVVALMSCGGANDGKLGTDTTHFSTPAPQANPSGMGESPKGHDRMVDSMGGTTGPTSPALSSGSGKSGINANTNTGNRGNGTGTEGGTQSEPSKNSKPH